MTTETTEMNLDIDGTIMSVCETVQLAEGIKAKFYREPGASEPHEIALYIGEAYIEMNYSEEVADVLGRLDEVSVIKLLTMCYRNQWRVQGSI